MIFLMHMVNGMHYSYTMEIGFKYMAKRFNAMLDNYHTLMQFRLSIDY
jgi:hypothetical protein